MHTPARGLELVNLYFLRLQTYLFESPVPSLLPALAALALAPALAAFDRLLLASCGLLVGMYFAYWHDGFFLGPRFLFPLTPVLALWTARLPGLVRRRFGSGFIHRFVLAGYAVTALMALVLQVPARARPVPQRPADDALGRRPRPRPTPASGTRWCSCGRAGARSWSRGCGGWACALRTPSGSIAAWTPAGSRPRSTDAERTGVARPGGAGRPHTAAGRFPRVVRSPFSVDDSEGYLPGAAYEGRCAARLAEDSAGYTLYTPLLLARRGGNVYARDLHARDTVLMRMYPGRPVFLLRRAWAAVDAPIRFYPVRRDSLAEAWGVGRAAPGGAPGGGLR